MKRATTGIVALVLLCPDAFGQVYSPYPLNPYNPYGPNPYGPILVQPSTPAPYLPPPQKTAREKRAERDKAVAYIGEGDNSRSFIESCDEASDAALACSQPVAARLAAFHCSGQLGKLPRRENCYPSLLSKATATTWRCSQSSTAMSWKTSLAFPPS